jgi:hypothetical protein
MKPRLPQAPGLRYFNNRAELGNRFAVTAGFFMFIELQFGFPGRIAPVRLA